MNQYEEFIYKRTYARYIDEENRREDWDESVKRYEDFFFSRVPKGLMPEFKDAMRLVYSKDVMPSMRCLWSAGEALERENASGYNCSYRAIDGIRAFSEILYLLMCGVGVGFSVERQIIVNLPVVPENLSSDGKVVSFRDSKRGWAEGFDDLLNSLYNGNIPTLDFSNVRPKGARLVTFGGRASGPDPLIQLCNYTINTFKNAGGRRLNSSEIADIGCMIAQCVVSGGVRRSACIVLCNLSDQRMRHYKSGDWHKTHPHRAYANISVAYTEKPEVDQFTEEWLSLMRNGSGERGLVNRAGMMGSTSRVLGDNCGVNPCGEVVLPSKGLCNLTEAVARPWDDEKELEKKVIAATILGTLQSTLTNFKYLSPGWKKNAESERLLGVSITGCMDNLLTGYDVIADDAVLGRLKKCAENTNKKWAEALGINSAAAITCVKPSGTVSQLVGSASGLHPRFSPFYIRRVRVTATDPLCDLLKDSNAPWYPEVGESREKHITSVFEFPIKTPPNSECRHNITAIEQLDIWKAYKDVWCDHNPSVTIQVRDDEWLAVAAWVYEHWDKISGLSFLPFDGGNYPLMPYEEIDEYKYNELSSAFPEIDFSLLSKYEFEDSTEGAATLACVGGSCEI